MDRMSLKFIDRVALLKFNHPEVMNAVGGKMLEDFVEAIAQIKARGSEALLLLTGETAGFARAPISMMTVTSVARVAWRQFAEHLPSADV